MLDTRTVASVSSSDSGDPRPPKRRRVLTATLVVAAFVLGLVVPRLWADRADVADAPPVAADAVTPAQAPDTAGQGSAAQTLSGPVGPVVNAADTATPQQAVDSYLATETAADFAASFEYLSAEERSRYGTAAAWVTDHRDVWPITGFEVTDITVTGDQATAGADLALRSGLDPVLGLIPARAQVVYPLVREDDAWRVVPGESQLSPLYPDPGGAAAAPAEWIDTSCQGAESMLGVTDLAVELCGTTSPVEVVAAVPIDAASLPADLVAVYGPEAGAWAYVATLSAPQERDLLLAPVNDTWTVIGVYPGGALT